MNTRRWWTSVVACVLLAAHTTPAQPQFRAGTELVVVDVVATRLDGNIARHLTAEDFEIYEDGVPQPIRTFEFVDLEADMSTDLAGVFSNGGEPGAIFALVVDELSVEARHTLALRRWAGRFVDEQVRADDYLAVMNTGVDSALLLTRDHDLVASKLAGVSGRGAALTAITPSGKVQTSNTAEGPTVPDFSGVDQIDPLPELRMTTEKTISTLRQIVDYLAPIPARRKSVLLFSQGLALDLEALAEKGLSRGFEAMGELLDAAREGNVAIYTIDPRGLAGDDLAAATAEAQPPSADAGIDGLRDLARATGGRAVVNNNDLRGALQRIAAENRAYFLIGYEATNSSRSRTRLRRIDVRTRAAGVSLLHRSARMSTTESRRPARPLDVAPLPGGNLFVALAPALFPDPKTGVSLAVPFQIGRALPDGTGATYSLVAIGTDGRQAGGTSGKLSAADGRAAGVARLHLKPGRYQVRLTGSAPDDQQGLAMADVYIPAGGAVTPECGGFFVAQKGATNVQASATRHLRSDAGLMIAAIVSARQAVPATFELLAQQGAGLSFTLTNPAQVGPGLWRYELTLPSPLPRGGIDLLLLSDDKPIPGCRAELIVE